MPNERVALTMWKAHTMLLGQVRVRIAQLSDGRRKVMTHSSIEICRESVADASSSAAR